MKKVLLLAAFGVAGLMSAKNGDCKNEFFLKIKPPGYQLTVSVTTSCGTSWSQSLHFDTYPTANDLQNIANAININFCNTPGGTGKVVPSIVPA